MSSNEAITYKDAGVDIDAGNKLVDEIKPAVKSTNNAGSMDAIGGFGGLFDISKFGYNDPILVAATDGVGTKLELALLLNNLDYIGQDLVAMCVNDLVVQGARPLFFLDYYACGKLDVGQATSVVKGIANACKAIDCALIGGETAEMPGLYKPPQFDLAGFSVGAAEREGILPKKDSIKTGDVIIGLKSSGFHSNGYSLVRKIIKEKNLDLNADYEGIGNLGDAVIKPTKLYVNECLDLLEEVSVKAFCHITGGGFLENIPRILSSNNAAIINKNSYEVPELFNLFGKLGNIPENELYKTFNMGIGMIAIVSKDDASKLDYEAIGEIVDNNQDTQVIIK